MNTRGKVEQFVGNNTHLNESARGSIMNDEKDFKEQITSGKRFWTPSFGGVVYTIPREGRKREKRGSEQNRETLKRLHRFVRASLPEGEGEGGHGLGLAFKRVVPFCRGTSAKDVSIC